LECRGQFYGPALIADFARINKMMLLGDRFQAAGTGSNVGTVRLLDARVGSLACFVADLASESGPALIADRLQVDQNIALGKNLNAKGAGKLGTVRLHGVHVGGRIACDATIHNDSGPAVIADHLRANEGLILSSDCTITGTGEAAVLGLDNASIGGEWRFSDAKIKNSPNKASLISLDGLTYAGLPGATR
jgi:hypothetical protein